MNSKNTQIGYTDKLTNSILALALVSGMRVENISSNPDAELLNVYGIKTEKNGERSIKSFTIADGKTLVSDAMLNIGEFLPNEAYDENDLNKKIELTYNKNAFTNGEKYSNFLKQNVENFNYETKGRYSDIEKYIKNLAEKNSDQVEK